MFQDLAEFRLYLLETRKKQPKAPALLEEVSVADPDGKAISGYCYGWLRALPDADLITKYTGKIDRKYRDHLTKSALEARAILSDCAVRKMTKRVRVQHCDREVATHVTVSGIGTVWLGRISRSFKRLSTDPRIIKDHEDSLAAHRKEGDALGVIMSVSAYGPPKTAYVVCSGDEFSQLRKLLPERKCIKLESREHLARLRDCVVFVTVQAGQYSAVASQVHESVTVREISQEKLKQPGLAAWVAEMEAKA